MVRQRLLKWLAKVATSEKGQEVEAFIRKHSAEWYLTNTKCTCKFGGAEGCCCKVAMGWEEDGFEDYTFGGITQNPSVRKLFKEVHQAKSIAKRIKAKVTNNKMGDAPDEVNINVRQPGAAATAESPLPALRASGTLLTTPAVWREAELRGRAVWGASQAELPLPGIT